jgi:uncharacterized protein YndB with AHSA1/START domain
MATSSTDRIEQQIELSAPLARVWQALTDHQQFGSWFRVALEAPFVPGQPTQGRITHPGYEHVVMRVVVQAIEPPRLFSFRWHPYAVDPAVDYSSEPMTLVEFRLEPTASGTRLSVSESGFDAIPAGRRAEAFRMNQDGWSGQMRNIADYVQA